MFPDFVPQFARYLNQGGHLALDASKPIEKVSSGSNNPVNFPPHLKNTQRAPKINRVRFLPKHKEFCDETE